MRHATMIAVLAAASLATAPAAPAPAQPRWQEVGKLPDGSPVYVDRRSVRRAGDSVRATVRVRFAKPRKFPAGEVTSSRTALTFDCPKKTVAIRENIYFHDERTNRIFQRSAPGIPGFGPVLGGSMTAVAFDDLCAARVTK